MKFTVDDILKRANELGLVLYVELSGEIGVIGPQEHLTERLYRTLREYRDELHKKEVLSRPLCLECVNENRETIAICEDACQILHCSAHTPQNKVDKSESGQLHRSKVVPSESHSDEILCRQMTVYDKFGWE